ncbi:MAG: hypothetical protein GY926_25845, partial [bacterium]|nr:hypothetical protein [bacterium]
MTALTWTRYSRFHEAPSFCADITPPVIDASLEFTHGSRRSAWFDIAYACTDASGVVVEANINDVPVIDGEEVHLIKINRNGHPRWHRDGNGRLTIWDFRFTMTVDCEDGAGNTTVETVTPEFRKHKKS